MSDNDEKIIKDKVKNPKIYDDQTLENIKKYYNIDDHKDLLKFIKLNRATINVDDYFDKDDDIIVMDQSKE